MRSRWKIIGPLVLAACLAVEVSCKGAGAGKPKGGTPVTPVLAAKVEPKTVPLELSEVGNVEPISSVEVRSQVGGILSAISIREGQDVKPGDLLFTIDPSFYQSQLRQAQGNLSRDQAQLAYAQTQAQRNEELFKKDLIAREQFDQTAAQLDALRGTVAADQAAVQNATLTLAYCYLKSPITGRTGSLNAHVGDLINVTDVNPMLTIVQLKPIYVNFAAAERELPEIKKRMAEGTVKVLAGVGEKAGTEEGLLTFVDNAIDERTGAIRMKATFDNNDEQLWPGQFVTVIIRLGERKDALTVPAAAVQTGQNGKYVYVVKPDRTVESRPVSTSIEYQGLAVIDDGLKPGEQVVTDGLLQLFPGAKVEIKDATPARP